MNKEKLKIKMIIGINDFLVGGAQALIVDLLKHFDMSKFDITLVTLFQFSQKDEFYDRLPENLKVKKFNFSGFRDIESIRKLYLFLKESNPDVVVSNLFFSNFIFRILKPFLKYKIIIVEHNTYIFKPRLQIILDKLLSLITFKIIAVSETVKTFTLKQEKIDPNKIVTIHNGINILAIKEFLLEVKYPVKMGLGFSEDDRIIINVSRLTQQKNQHLLIDAFSLFSRNHLEYKLLILGDGSLKQELEQKIKTMGLKKKVFLLGSRKDVYKFYPASDFFMSTSLIEGLSIAYLEALAFGVPILATKTAGTDELIIEKVNGAFVRGQNPKDVAEEMENFLKNDLAKMSENAKNTAEKFNIVDTVKSYENLIISALA